MINPERPKRLVSVSQYKTAGGLKPPAKLL